MTNNGIVDAGEALAGDVAPTTTIEAKLENNATLGNLKTVQAIDKETIGESKIAEDSVSEDDEIDTWLEAKDKEDKSIEDPKEEKEVSEDEEPIKEEDKEEEEEEDEDEEEDLQDDITYIKDHPEKILELIQDLQENKFQNKWKRKYELESAEKEELEKRYNEMQKQKYADKYDDANLPVLENKRPFWRAQNKFYDNMDNDAHKSSYIRRLEEELEDIRGDSKTVSIDDNGKSKP